MVGLKFVWKETKPNWLFNVKSDFKKCVLIAAPISEHLSDGLILSSLPLTGSIHEKRWRRRRRSTLNWLCKEILTVGEWVEVKWEDLQTFFVSYLKQQTIDFAHNELREDDLWK